MRHLIIAAALLTASALPAATAPANPYDGVWNRDCGNGTTCSVSMRNSQLTFSIVGQSSCRWTVDMAYDSHDGIMRGYDPHGNYGFYVDLKPDGSLYSSGTMLQICGPQPLHQVFVGFASSRTQAQAVQPVSQTMTDDEARALVENRAISDHNGSAMFVNPGDGTIIYRTPKSSISGTVRPGALLFRAESPWDPYDDTHLIKGTAYVFKKGCEPAPYPVQGRQQGWHTIELFGPAPVREKTGCRIIGYKVNGNSTLKFVSWGD